MTVFNTTYCTMHISLFLLKDTSVRSSQTMAVGWPRMPVIWRTVARCGSTSSRLMGRLGFSSEPTVKSDRHYLDCLPLAGTDFGVVGASGFPSDFGGAEGFCLPPFP